jgi:hypothetical protein
MTRPYLSVQISSPLLPMTTAVCAPAICGRCVSNLYGAGEMRTIA